jgi:hypothetical protein
MPNAAFGRNGSGQPFAAVGTNDCYAEILLKNSKIREARISCERKINRRSPPAMPMAITETPSDGRRQNLADPSTDKA